MNIPKDKLIIALQNLCSCYIDYNSVVDDTYLAKVETISILFSIQKGLITANVQNIIREESLANWGDILYKCLRDHQAELGIDYD